uniref:Glycoside hydrolase family 5 domain-containing protein n=1 Tax=Tetradesmus obliquus TaxID=3088 RepID=A0A383W7Z6_TETOB|eukprot:jgi/Sobl393_1/3245/SZX73765.1
MKPLLVLVAALMLGHHVQAAPANIQDSFLTGFKGPFPTLGGYAGTEISSTVPLLYQNDWDVNYLGKAADDWSSKCIDMVYKANEFQAKVVNCCPKVNKLAIDRFRFGLQWCLAKAVELGLDIAITPHLDDGLEMGGWRNALVFDPLVKYGNFSYYDVMLRPIAQALNAVITPDTQVLLAMQGEMSATVVRYPRSWTSLVSRLKNDIVTLRDDADQLMPNLKVGALKPAFKLDDLEDAIWQFDEELKQFGPNLKDLIHNQGKALILSEYGVGGGVHQNGSVPAKTAAEAAQFPFFGIWGSYSPAIDPWNTTAPEDKHIEVRDWRRRFYKETSRWLMDGGGSRYRVDGLYLWSLASWDVQAIHYASSSSEGSYRDPIIAATITQHNKYVHSPYRRRAHRRRTLKRV